MIYQSEKLYWIDTEAKSDVKCAIHGYNLNHQRKCDGSSRNHYITMKFTNKNRISKNQQYNQVILTILLTSSKGSLPFISCFHWDLIYKIAISNRLSLHNESTLLFPYQTFFERFYLCKIMFLEPKFSQRERIYDRK